MGIWQANAPGAHLVMPSANRLTSLSDVTWQRVWLLVRSIFSRASTTHAMGFLNQQLICYQSLRENP